MTPSICLDTRALKIGCGLKHPSSPKQGHKALGPIGFVIRRRRTLWGANVEGATALREWRRHFDALASCLRDQCQRMRPERSALATASDLECTCSFSYILRMCPATVARETRSSAAAVFKLWPSTSMDNSLVSCGDRL